MTNSNSNYLQSILTELFTSDKDVSKTLSGGARLDWNATRKTLTATRLNRGLESAPSEQKTFEREIRQCGYAHTHAAPVAIQADSLGNERIGVRWVVTKAIPKQSKAALKRETQGGLFE